MSDDSDEEDMIMQAACVTTMLTAGYYQYYVSKIPCRTSALSGAEWVEEVLTGHGAVPRKLSYGKTVFLRLCDILQTKGLLTHSIQRCRLSINNEIQCEPNNGHAELVMRTIGSQTTSRLTCFKLHIYRIRSANPGWLLQIFLLPNRASIFATHGYLNGINAPGRRSPPNGNCTGGDSLREPYIVSHNLLLAHTRAVNIYKTKYQEKQKGMIRISLHSDWYMPYSSSQEVVDATQRVLDNTFGLYMDPIVIGDYPLSVKQLVRDRLPVVTDQESKDIKGSFDYIGINHYVETYVMNNSTFVPPLQAIILAKKSPTTPNFRIPLQSPRENFPPV
ncbi:hypothetical protein IFM89_001192 [Coptis chinensis]|uniref:DUF8040 domain-containing protein n=1 Tax=Coptis chinensis TaxID=261450 RepID=A0A835IJW7_9MAGN|nr:hypothetical protein IFM89_001192 [Coptis chinensis]